MISVRERITRKNKPSAAEKREGMSKAHIALIKQLPCCITGKRPVDPHHLKEGLAHERGIGRKATDRWAVPLCREKHEEVERIGSRNEWAWFKKHGIEDPLELAAALWRNTGDLDRMLRVIEAHRVVLRSEDERTR
jgi:hypothetical protein